MIDGLMLFAGFALLVLGGDLLVRGAVRVAALLGLSPLVIGLTLVGFGTSTPELVTSVQAALVGSPGIAYGNIVGSNIANLLLILGVSAVITPIAVASGALQRDGAVMIGVAVAFAAIAWAAPMSPLVGAVFLAGLAGYILLAIRQERTKAPDLGAVHDKSAATTGADPELDPGRAPVGPLWRPLLFAAAGLGAVMLGGSLLVQAATALARDWGVSETVVGLTVVAVGTSLPELATSVLAAMRREADVAFGNIVGSNIYNILGIGGTTALIAPAAAPAEILVFDNPVMIGVSLLAVAFAWSGRRIARWEGALLLLCYAIYVAALWPA